MELRKVDIEMVPSVKACFEQPLESSREQQSQSQSKSQSKSQRAPREGQDLEQGEGEETVLSSQTPAVETVLSSQTPAVERDKRKIPEIESISYSTHYTKEKLSQEKHNHLQEQVNAMKLYFYTLLIAIPFGLLQTARFAQSQIIKTTLLGLDWQDMASFIWILNPIVDMITLPLVGHFYDIFKHVDKKSPLYFVLTVNLVAILGLILSASWTGWGVREMVVGALILIRASMGGIFVILRAMSCDLERPGVQFSAQLAISAFMGIGGFIGSLLMTQVFTYTQLTTLILTCISLLTIVLGLFSAVFRTEFYSPDHSKEKGYKHKGPWVKLGAVFTRETAMILILVMTAWTGLTAWNLTAPIYYGCPKGLRIENFSTGDRGESCLAAGTVDLVYSTSAYAFSLELGYLVQTGVALFMSHVVYFLPERGVQHASRFVVSGACVIAAGSVLAVNAAGGMVVGVGVGCVMAVIQAFPFAYVGLAGIRSKTKHSNGLFIGVLSASCAVPQLILTLIPNLGVDWGLVVTGVGFGVAAFLALFIKERLADATGVGGGKVERKQSHLRF